MIPTKVVHCKRSKKPERGTCDMMRKVTCLRAPSPVEMFYKQEIPCPNGSCDAVAYRTDIYMLFNQQRLDRMSLSQLSDWLDNQTPTSGLAELRSKMSDAQLHSFIKSRYIQSPSELMAWSEYIQSEFTKEYQKAVEEQQNQQPADPAAPAAPAEPAAPAVES